LRRVAGQRGQRVHGRRRPRRSRQVCAQVAAIGLEHRLRDGAEQGALGGTDRVATQEERAALLMLPRAPGAFVQERGESTGLRRGTTPGAR